MLKLTKKADYGLIALKHLAEAGQSASAKEIADAYDLPQEALAKILQKLAKAKFLVSQHGTNGGYGLSKPPQEISAFEVIRVLEGPLFLTSCSTDHGDCHQLSKCNVKEPLAKVSLSIREVLTKITIADMMDASGPRIKEDSSAPRVNAAELVTLA
jgi:Rrf2 family protein